MRITLAQLNPTVGDIEGNLLRLHEVLKMAAQEGSDLLVLPELFLVGYPPRDLLDMPWFTERLDDAIRKLLAASELYPETGILTGVPLHGRKDGVGLYNSAILVLGGRLLFTQHKSLLPTYDVFDERRYFDPAEHVRVFPFKGHKLGISICEDAWNDKDFWPRLLYDRDPIAELASQGATLLINISASPFQAGKEEIRYNMLAAHARHYGVPFIYLNQVGANDELIFDGCSLVLDAEGDLWWEGPGFQECVHTIDLRSPSSGQNFKARDKIETVYEALALGIKDYTRKCGFSRVILGLSGGIDSAVTACLAVKALGPENVLGLTMPSPYSSAGSIDDSRQLAVNLGIEFEILPIGDIFSSYLNLLHQHWPPDEANLSEENIQARIRGNILMAFSNRFGYLLLSTGNKSEMAVGYCTLYGDMSGGLSVLSDIPKIMVYELAHYINRCQPLIPEQIITKPPSAELKPGQLDQDSLPPYEILDAILHYYIEEKLSPGQIIAQGFDRETVAWVIKQVNHNEYKRRQAAPGLKVSGKAFGPGRRMPIAARWEL